MRILTRHIHRAFRQLDPYSDEVCRKFIRAARGPLRLRVMLAAPVWAAAAAFTLGGVWLWVRVFDAMIGLGASTRDSPSWRGIAVVALAAPAALGLGPVAGYILRDRILAWRLWYILAMRGRCYHCGYSLVGLAVGGGGTVGCPECGTECEVDQSLSELTVERGVELRKVRAGAEGAALSPRARRWGRRVLMGLAALVLVVAPGFVGVWELLVRLDASRASAVRANSGAAMSALLAKRLARASGPSMHEAEGRLSTVLEEARRAWGVAHPAATEPPDLAILRSRSEDWMAQRGETAEQHERGTAEAEELWRLANERGLIEAITGLAESTPRAPTEGLPPVAAPGFTAGMRSVRAVEEVIAIVERRGAEGRLRAASLSLGMARGLAVSPAPMDKLWSAVFAHNGLDMLTDLLAERPDAAGLAAIGAVAARAEYDLGAAESAEWSRLESHLSLAMIYEDPANVRLGPLSRLSKDLRIPGLGFLGSLSANQGRIDELLTFPAGYFGVDPSRRPAMPASSRVTVADWCVSSPAYSVNLPDLVEAHRRGVRVLLAIEGRRVSAGAYPAALDRIAGLPVDPWTGAGFVYMPVAQAAWAATVEGAPRWPFVLYATGPDAVDNQGRDGGFGPLWAPAGCDVVITPPRSRR